MHNKVHQNKTETSSEEKIQNLSRTNLDQANRSIAMAITAAVRKQKSFKFRSKLSIISSSWPSDFPDDLLIEITVFLNLLTAEEIHTSPRPNPVLKSFDAEKGTPLQRVLHMTDRTTATPVPAMLAEKRDRRSSSWGPDFFKEMMTFLSFCFLPAIRESKLSHAWR